MNQSPRLSKAARSSPTYSGQQINLKNNAAHTPRGWLHRAPSLPLLTPRTSAWSLDGPLASAKR